jgi:hypothetical protein
MYLACWLQSGPVLGTGSGYLTPILMALHLMKDRDFAASVSDPAENHLTTQCRYREVEITVNVIGFVF